jgi:2-(1,2-epoxy-1,2-dihydrophenyl)acetyl-CoA isomerase
MTYETVRYEKEGRIAILTFNRPHVMNAHNYHMKVEEQEAAREAMRDDDVRVLIVTGAGRGFHAGEDVKDVFLGGDFDKLKADRRKSWLGDIDPDAWTGQVSPRYFYGYPKPTIAAVNGAAVGAGLSIAISCDIRIASENARFGYFYTRRGLMGTTRGLVMLINLIGVSRAMEMMLSGEMIEAAEADRTGLVSRVVPQDELLDQAKQTAHKLMKGAPLAQRAIKACLYKALYEPSGLEDYNTLVEAALAETEDHTEGSRAYAEKREPQWMAR